MTDATGQAIVSYEYDAFGGLKSVTGTLANEFRFTGEQWDDDAGLYYLRARYYDPSTGRFISRDTFPGTINNPFSQHGYNYAQSNPVNFTDPSGKWTLSFGVGGAFFAAVGVRVTPITVAIDDKGNIALLSGGGGGGWSAVGVNRLGPSVTVTNAPTVHHLAGDSVQFGGQIGEVASVGAEWVTFSDGQQSYYGLNVAGGGTLQAPFPFEVHASWERSSTWLHFNVFDILGQVWKTTKSCS